MRRDGEWLAFYSGSDGVKRKADDIVIPSHVPEAELKEYISDVFHEWATPEQGDIGRE